MPYPPSETLTTREACLLVGVSRHTLMVWEHAGNLPRLGKVNQGAAVTVTYDAAAVLAAAEIARLAKVKPPKPEPPPPFVAPEGMLTAAEVAATLGVTLHTVNEMQREGRLRPAEWVTPPQGGSRMRLYDEGEVSAFAEVRDGRGAAQRVSAVADALRSGMPLPEALDVCGVSRTTWKYWARTRGDAAEAEAVKVPTIRRPHPGTLHAGRIGRVYFISGPGKLDAIKIGWTQGELDERVAALQCGSPVPLLVLASVRAFFAFERWCHRELCADRSYGEWFRRSAQLVAFVGRLRDLGDVTGHTPDELRAMLRPEPLSLFGGTHGPTP